ncbi:DNA recombination protein RmuC [Eubacteriales bacterium OttesenSCG-928-A19]|nr:DNA recombination protein RmuC [Eubacteriales bacterium OttesenSCG-928-A19]
MTEPLAALIAGPLPVIAGVGLLLLLCVIPLRRSMIRQRKSIDRRLREIDAMLDDGLRALHETNTADRSEITAGIRDMSDSVVQFIGEVSRLQQQQLDSFGAQIRAMNRTDEERLERMRQSIEERLMAYDRQMTRVSQTLEEKLAINERRLGEMRLTLDGGMRRIQEENDRKLEQIRVTVDEKLNATLDKRLSESFRTVSERLEQVYRGLGEMQQLAVGVGELKRVLTSVKARGVWGEVQLGALLSEVLTRAQYEENVCVKPGSAERVEYAVRMPGREDSGGEPVYLPIDAKFPAEDYQRLLDAADAADKQGVEAAGRALEQTIKVEARRIHDKYIAPPHTTDFAIMFLPVEGLFAEVLRRPGIVETLQREFRVVVTGPTTLMALLGSLQMGFRTLAIERRSSEVWELLGAVKTEFGNFSTLLSKTQQRLRQASDSIEVAARKTRTIERRLKDVQALSLPGMMETTEMEEAEEDGLSEP